MEVTRETSDSSEGPIEFQENHEKKPHTVGESPTHTQSKQTLGKLEPQNGSWNNSNRTMIVVSGPTGLSIER